MKTIDKPCADCGVMMVGVSKNRVYCVECAKRRARYIVDKPCAQCGVMMYGVVTNRLYCPTCVTERIKSRQKKMPTAWHVGQRYNKPCVDCGQIMYGVHGSKQVCAECQKIRAKMRRHGQTPYADLIKQAAKPGHAPKNHTLNEDALAATNEGLSYGYYILKHGLF